MKKFVSVFLLSLIAANCFGAIIIPSDLTNANNQQTKLLLEGTTTTFRDISVGGGGKVMTAVNDATWSAGQTLYGKNTIAFDGTADAVKTAGNVTDFTFGTGEGTIDFWVYLNSIASFQTLFSNFGDGATSFDATNRYTLSVNGTTGATYLDGLSNGNAFTSTTSGFNLAAGVWTHVALTFNGTVLRLWKNGVLTITYVLPVAGLQAPQTAGMLFLVGGYADDGGYRYCANGYISNFRVTKGRVLWTKNFTPPLLAIN